MWRPLGIVKTTPESNQIVRVLVEKTPKILEYNNRV